MGQSCNYSSEEKAKEIEDKLQEHRDSEYLAFQDNEDFYHNKTNQSKEQE